MNLAVMGTDMLQKIHRASDGRLCPCLVLPGQFEGLQLKWSMLEPGCMFPEAGLPVQEAGRKLEDPNWRIRPAALPRFGACTQKSSNGPVTPGQSPVIQRGASSTPATNGHAKPRFRFGVPSAQYLSFAGPGGDDFADGKPLARSSQIAFCLSAAETAAVQPLLQKPEGTPKLI